MAYSLDDLFNEIDPLNVTCTSFLPGIPFRATGNFVDRRVCNSEDTAAMAHTEPRLRNK
jgi:hypothetical protein